MPHPPISAVEVSVVTAAYNAEATLERAHRSLHSEDCIWEHIIVNDGSQDATESLARSFSGRVVVVSQENRGLGAALNTGLDHASGELIAFLDADDEYLPGHLDLRVALFRAEPAVDLVWGGLDLVLAEGDPGTVPDVVKGSGEISLHECVVQGTIFGRRRVFADLRYTEDRKIWYQDYDLVTRARERFDVRKVEFPTYRYYRNSGTSMVDRVRETWPKY